MKHTSEHPTNEEWVSFLYSEDSLPQRATLAAHLEACPQCRAQVGRWRQTQHALDAWTLPTPAPAKHRFRQPVLRWAAAAVILVGVGIGIGRLTSPAALEAASVRRALQTELDAKLAATRSDLLQVLDHRQGELAQALRTAAADAASTEAGQLLTEYAKLLEQQRDSDRESYLAAFGSLREQIQTVALNADDSLTRTQEQLLELASRSPNP